MARGRSVGRSAKRGLACVAAIIAWLAGAPAAPGATLGTSSYFGGSHHDQVIDVAVDPAGNVYVTGWTMSPDLPVRNPVFGFTGGEGYPDCEHFGCPDAFVAKLAPGGRELIYATYLAGSRLDEATGIALDTAGNAYVVGRTNSEDFPAGGDPQTVSGGSRVFVVKLAPDGSFAWTRYVGPTGSLTEADVAVDDAGRLYVVGETNNTDFPTTPGAYDRECRDRTIPGPCIDAYVARLTTSGAHVATTMLGGNDSHETGTSVAIDRAGRPVVAGYVGAPMYGFPTTPGTYGETPEPSGRAAFVARLSADLAQLEWAAAFGGRDGDHVLGLALDPQDRPVVVGSTDSRDYPTTPGAVDRQCNNSDDWYSCPGTPDGFATKLTHDGSGLVWSTYLGGFGEDVAHAVAADGHGVAIAGATSHAQTFPLRDPYQAQVRYSQAECPGPSLCTDSFLVRLSDSGGLVLGTVLGGVSMEEARGVAIDPGGGAWIAGTAFSDDVPVTAGALQPARAGGDCPMSDLQRFPNCSDGLLAAFAPGSSAPASDPVPASAPASAVPSSTPAAEAARPTLAPRRLTVRRRGRDLVGRLRGDPRCVSGARILVERRDRGRRRVVRRARTGARGRFSVRLPARRGRYQVRAPAVTRAGVACGAARVPVASHGSVSRR
jgi:hypothetical protein